MRWCEFAGRNIFNSIGDLHQELRCLLCCYGQLQGSFLKGTIKMHISLQVSYYLLNKMASDGLPSELVSISINLDLPICFIIR